MKSEMRMKMMIARAKRSTLGRVLCRLAGDQAGAVMMEYVILAVLIAAAVAAVVGFFGRDIGRMFGVMSNSLFSPNTAAADYNAAGGASAADGAAADAVQGGFNK